MPTAPAISRRAPFLSEAAQPAAARAGVVRWVGTGGWVLASAWLAAMLLIVAYLDRGWVPHDDGALAQSAQRVLDGELPHRDFDEIYTGGLSYLHALAFQLFGTHLLALRYLLLAGGAAWIAALCYVATRFAPPLPSAVAVLLCVGWSLPNYFAALPSWYNLFFATFGVAALLRYVETGRTRWVFLGGICAGASIAIKVVGVYFVAAALLFLVFREQSLSDVRAGRHPAGGRGYGWFVSGGLLAFAAALAALIGTRAGPATVVHFALPGLGVAGLLAWNEWRGERGPSRRRLACLLRTVLPFLLGAAVPVAALLLPYVASGSVAQFLHGVFVLPGKRMDFAALPPPALRTALGALVQGALLVGGLAWLVRRRPRVGLSIALAVAGGILLLSWQEPSVYRAVWNAVRLLAPVTVLYGAHRVSRATREGSVPALRTQQVVLLLATTAVCSLVQYPFSAPVYFCYTAPLLVLSLLALYSLEGPAPRQLGGLCAGFFLLFALGLVNTGFIHRMGLMYFPDPQSSTLSLDRGGIRVGGADRHQYERLVAEIRHRASGAYIYATPDSPEVYFLSGFRNPTRSLFEFFDEPHGRTERILRTLEQTGVSVVAINRKPDFSGPVAPDLLARLEQRYPRSMDVGDFELRWRE